MLGKMFQIATIDANANAVIKAVTYKGVLDPTPVKVECKSLIEDYNILNAKFPTNADYSTKSAITHYVWQITECTSKINIGLSALAKKVGLVNVVVREIPQKQVFACQAFDVGACKLVPAGAKIKVVNKSNGETVSSWDKAMKCEGDLECDSHDFHVSANSMTDVVVPALFVKAIDKKERANMVVSMLEVTVSHKDVGKAVTSKISLPALVNDKPIQEGEELFYFKCKEVVVSKKRPFDVV